MSPPGHTVIGAAPLGTRRGFTVFTLTAPSRCLTSAAPSGRVPGMTDRPKHAPPNATPKGLICYRICEAGDEAFDLGETDLARKLWGISDDLRQLSTHWVRVDRGDESSAEVFPDG